MKHMRQVMILGFAIFAGFFGAGNLILPPNLGLHSGSDWWLSAAGFLLSATLIPMLALFGHARLQGTMLDFGNKVSKRFSFVLSLGIYLIAVSLPCPRTAAVTHEMSVAPYFQTSSLLTSTLYFTLVLVFVLQRGKVMEILGKYLTPLIVLILLSIIGIGSIQQTGPMGEGLGHQPMVTGFLEGYQTYDALAGMLFGGVLVLSVGKMFGPLDRKKKQGIILQASLVAVIGLVLIYAGLIYLGAKNSADFPGDISRTALLSALSEKTLGNMGGALLSILVALACFTTAVGIIVGTSDFFKGVFNDSQKAYRISAVICCLVGVAVGQLEVQQIITVAMPVLLFIYPVVMVLIFLNLLPEKYASRAVFRGVVLVAVLFSLPDVIGSLAVDARLGIFYDSVPFSRSGMAWVLPAVLAFFAVNGIDWINKKPLKS